MVQNSKYKKLLAAIIFSCVCMHSFAWDPAKGERPKAIENYEYVDGSTINFDSLLGKPTVLYFGGDWCPPCRLTRPHVLKLAEQFAGKVNIVFVSSDDNKFRPFKLDEARNASYKIAMPMLTKYPADTTRKGTSEMGPFGKIYWWPTVVLLDSKGIVVQKMEKGELIKRNLADELAELLK